MHFTLDEKGYKKTTNRQKKIKYIITENDCWECISHSKNHGGYPQVQRNGKLHGMHRFIYNLYKGDIPKGIVVMHKCDNRICINPDHLELGTYKDNTQDMYNKCRNISNKGKKYKKKEKG